MSRPDHQPGAFFITGGTGYVGSRLIPRLLDRGYDVRALARAARVFRQESVRTALRQAQTPDAVLAILAPGSITDAA